MEEQAVSAIPTPVPPEPEPQPPVTKPHPLLPIWLIALLVVIIGSIAVFAAYGILSRPAGPSEQVAVLTPTPTPTPIRTPSALASQSAFLELEAAVTSLSSQLQSIPLSDPSLSPPALNLELGFEL